MVASKPKSRTVRALRGGQMTIPIEIRRELGIDEDTLLRVEPTGDGGFAVHPVRTPAEALRELFELFAPARQEAIEKGYTDEEINGWIDQAIAEVRAEQRANNG
jgi:bifunctional DNA-binding transcriptional regulator/antitoxin component of YhaV-PrlF toxin-antitoxin module